MKPTCLDLLHPLPWHIHYGALVVLWTVSLPVPESADLPFVRFPYLIEHVLGQFLELFSDLRNVLWWDVHLEDPSIISATSQFTVPWLWVILMFSRRFSVARKAH